MVEAFLAFEKVKADVRNAVEDFGYNLFHDHRSIEKAEEDVIVVDAKKEAEVRIFYHPSNDLHDCHIHRPDLCPDQDNVIEDEKVDNSLLSFLSLHCQNFLYANYLHDVNDCSYRQVNVELIVL